MENNGEQFYKMMMEVKRAIGILEDVCEKLTLEYFKPSLLKFTLYMMKNLMYLIVKTSRMNLYPC